MFSTSQKDELTIVPVLVGALSDSKEQMYGELFSKYLADPLNLFVISSDFCHWGMYLFQSHCDSAVKNILGAEQLECFI